MKGSTQRRTHRNADAAVYTRATVAAAAAAAAVAIGGTAWGQGNVAVRVNQQTVDFNGQAPIEQDGRVLVPLRGVLEKMGAYVQYDSGSRMVTAFEGDRKIVLPIGQRTATVDGRQVSLDVPAQVVNGSTMVPLRFVAESLGARVRYDVASNTVSINAPQMGGTSSVASNALPPADRGQDTDATAGEQRSIVGRVQAVYSDVTPARVVVRIVPGGGAPGMAPGSVQTFLLRRDTALNRERPNGANEPISLARIAVGDRVSILRARDGDAVRIDVLQPPGDNGSRAADEDHGNVFKGRFRRWQVLDDHLARLEMQDGRTVDVRRDVLVMNAGQAIALDDLRPGDAVTVSVDPRTGIGSRVLVTFRQ